MPSSIPSQARTLHVANHRGERYSEVEIEFIKDTVRWEATEVALAMGRTLNAVYTMRSLHAWTREYNSQGNTGRPTSNLPQAPVVACGACWTVHPVDVDCY